MKLIVADLTDLNGEEDALQYFPAARRAEIVRFQGEDDRARSTVAEAILRLEIMQSLSLSPDRIDIRRGERGKPYLAGFPHFCFNASHAGMIAVCAFDDAPVGVDVEKIRPIDFRSIAARCFSERERAELCGGISAFFRVWTAKESAVKQRGGSLANGLKRLDTAGDPSFDGAPLACAISSYRLRSGEKALLPAEEEGEYMLSVCSARSEHTMSAIFYTASEILKEFAARSSRSPHGDSV